MKKTIENVVLLSNYKDRVGRTYLKDEVISAIAKQPAYYGILGSEADFRISLDKVSHTIRNLRMEGDDLIGDIDIMETPMGNMLFQLMEQGVKFRTAMRAVGVLDEHMGVTELTIGGFDMVLDGQ